MKKQLLTATAALMMLGGAAANAQMCVTFEGFCDGLEVNVSGGQISGFWRNTDCAGTDIPVRGTIRGGSAKVACDGACLGGSRWGWVAETTLDGTMDMYTDPGAAGNWSIWIDELAYTTSLGPCPFDPFNGGGTPSVAQ